MSGRRVQPATGLTKLDVGAAGPCEYRRSNTRTEPSAETEANTPTPPQAMSYTSRSCAISCVSTTPFCAPQSGAWPRLCHAVARPRHHHARLVLGCRVCAAFALHDIKLLCCSRAARPRLNVPDGAGRVDTGRAQPLWVRLVPVKRRQRRAELAVLVLLRSAQVKSVREAASAIHQQPGQVLSTWEAANCGRGARC